MVHEFNKPERHRLQRLQVRLEKALDELARGAGEMRPRVFAPVRQPLDKAMAELDVILELVQRLQSGHAPTVQLALTPDDEEAA
jgi:carbamate kinase